MGPRVRLWFGLVLVLLGAIGLLISRPAQSNLPYKVLMKGATLTRIAQDLGPIVRTEFSPDGRVLLVGRLSGEVLALVRDAADPTVWQLQADPVVTIATSFPGFPPDENGLSGIAFAADYTTSQEVFFAYTIKLDSGLFRNRVARMKLVETAGRWSGEDLTDIFEANAPTAASHQIQDIEGVLVQEQSHVLFLVGEGFKAERALSLAEEAGKLMLIQRDGQDPLGTRPYPDSPKLQAIGIRNAPDLAINSHDPARRIAIVDTGHDNYDRLIYGKFLDEAGGRLTGLNLGWDGSTESLAADRSDPNSPGTPNTMLYRWDPTETATNVVFHPGKGRIDAATEQEVSIFINLFGRTGLTDTERGRKIVRATLDISQDQPVLSDWEPFVIRSKTGAAELGHPLALELDPVTKNLVFADILEGALYQVEIKE